MISFLIIPFFDEDSLKLKIGCLFMYYTRTLLAFNKSLYFRRNKKIRLKI